MQKKDVGASQKSNFFHSAKTILELKPPRLAEIKQPGQTHTFWSTWFLPPRKLETQKRGWGWGDLSCCSLFRT